MIFNKHTIKGLKDKTVIYNFDIEESSTGIIIKDLYFESPVGKKQLEGIQVDIEREEINKVVNIKVFVDSREDDVVVDEIYEGAEVKSEYIGLEGDIVASIFVPADVNKEVVVDYKEVIDENQEK